MKKRKKMKKQKHDHVQKINVNRLEYVRRKAENDH